MEKKRILEVSYKRSEAVIALSPEMKQGICSTGYPENRVSIVTNFSNILLFDHCADKPRNFKTSRGWSETDPLIVYTGAFGFINGLIFFVELAESLLKIDSNIKILLVGDGKEKDMIVHRATEIGVLNKNLFIINEVNKDELGTILCAADMASNVVIDVEAVWGNSANKFFDALAAGVPLLLNSGGWQAELIDKANAGVVLRGNSIDEDAIKVDNLLHDEVWMARARNQSLNLAKRYFDKDLLVKKVEEVLLMAIKKEGWRASLIGPCDFKKYMADTEMFVSQDVK